MILGQFCNILLTKCIGPQNAGVPVPQNAGPTKLVFLTSSVEIEQNICDIPIPT